MICMTCPECGEEILFKYITPDKTFKITKEALVRDDAWKGPEYDDPYLEFYCSGDREHDIDIPEIADWSEEITEEFYLYTLPST